MDTYHALTGAGTTTRDAKRLTGIARASADRDRAGRHRHVRAPRGIDDA
jgi:hypothetical protein